MKFAVFSDIHNNMRALEKMFECLYRRSIDGYICCGDIANCGYANKKIIELLKKLPNLHIVRGNHDAFCILDRKLIERLPSIYPIMGRLARPGLKMAGKLADCVGITKRGRLAFLSNLQEKELFCVDGKRVGVFHGTPSDCSMGKFSVEGFKNKGLGYDIIFLGHTHERINRKIGKTLVINPGSLGKPLKGDVHSYVIFDFLKENAEFFDICGKKLKCEVKHR